MFVLALSMSINQILTKSFRNNLTNINEASECRIYAKIELEKSIELKSNVFIDKLYAIKRLKNDNTIEILLTGKGNGTVILDITIKILQCFSIINKNLQIENAHNLLLNT